MFNEIPLWKLNKLTYGLKPTPVLIFVSVFSKDNSISILVSLVVLSAISHMTQSITICSNSFNWCSVAIE